MEHQHLLLERVEVGLEDWLVQPRKESEQVPSDVKVAVGLHLVTGKSLVERVFVT